MKDQSTLLEKDWDWLIICDGGRADTFAELYPDYLDGEFEVVYNGGFTFTANWFAHHFSEQYDTTLCHGGLPIYAFETNENNYDEREHFDMVIGWRQIEWDDRRATAPPDSIINVIKEDEITDGVVRFLQPHNPYRNLPPIKGEDDAKQYSSQSLRLAYRDNYRWIIKKIRNRLFNEIDITGKIIITSDHGQCLGDCGQYLHSPSHDKHNHLTNVPWLEINR